MKEKKQKSYALEIMLIVSAVLVAFVVQGVIKNTNPPERPELAGGKHAAAPGEGGDTEAAEAGNEDLEKQDAVPNKYVESLSDLGSMPDWESLDQYQFTLTKEEFVRELEEVYTLNGGWKKWVEIEGDYAMIRTDAEDDTKTYLLHFITPERVEKVKHYWRGKAGIKHADADLPLEGVRIVLDPGHIGGNYAAMEERKFKFNEMAAVEEGRLTLIVAHLLEKQLRALGAEVQLTRVSNSPVNPHRPQDYELYALSKMKSKGELVSEASVSRVSEKLFYRAGEIRARAKLVNEEFRPDLVVCLHFNAAGWVGETLVAEEHVHMILNGAYTEGELAKDDMRFALIERLLQRVHGEEAAVSASVAQAFALHTGLPPYQYEWNSKRALKVNGNPYLWARNLAANRSFHCPVVFCEPYLTNGEDSHARIQAGDYEGLNFVNGMLRPSIFREYVNSVTSGLVDYYKQREISE